MADEENKKSGWAGEAADRADGDEREELAETRTKMAEDRTVLANERTYAGWMRTGLASVGIGLAFNALFTSMEPWWIPRAIATAFFLVGIFVTISAERRACSVISRLHAHRVQTVGTGRLRTIAWVVSIAILALVAALWMLPVERANGQ
jgi:putative membrane protein